jgi:uncharacterized phiE125 gp8 family phage protein
MIRTSIKTETAGTSLLTTAQAKTHLREELSDATNDAYIDTLVSAAQSWVEKFTNRKLTAGTYDLYLTDFPKEIVLPFSPISEITHIKYYTGGVLTTLAAADYFYSIYEEPCRIQPDDTWPEVDDDMFAVQVRFKTGYTSPDVCPESLKHAVRLLLTDMYENRGNILKERQELMHVLLWPNRVFHSTIENTK